MTTPEKAAKAVKVAPVKPSVGRIVHFHNGFDSRPHAAIVIGVTDDRVDLFVFHPDAGNYSADAVQHQDDTKSTRHWNYPPRV